MTASYGMLLTSGTSIESELYGGLHWESGDSGNKTILDIGNNFGYKSSDAILLNTAYNSRISEFGGDYEMGVEGSFHFDQGFDNLGLLAVVQSGWGLINSPADWDLLLIGNEYQDSNYIIDAELGFGYNVLDRGGILNPYAGVVFENDTRGVRLGTRLDLGDLGSLEVGGQTRISRDNPNHGMNLRSNFKW